MTDFTRWLETQKAYQRDAFGLDWDEIGADAEKLTQYVTTMLNAMFLEVAEAQQEVPWKPWGTVDRAEVWMRNRDRYVGELVDVLFFAANALGAAGVTDRELAERYAAKMSVNVKRQEDGYNGFQGKCAECSRALDEPSATPVLIDGVPTFCSDDCRKTADALNRETLRGIGYSDARIDQMMAQREVTQ